MMRFVLWLSIALWSHQAVGQGKYDVPKAQQAEIREKASLVVAEATGVPQDIFRALIGGVGDLTGESGGKPGTVRWCTKWTTRPDGLLTCPNDRLDDGTWRQRSCYANCHRKEVWDNRLDTGLWQLRDAPGTVKGIPVKGWSWIRWFERNNYELPKHCALDSGCATEVMIAVVLHLKTQKPKTRCTKPMYIEQLQWLGLWNGCGTYKARVTYWLSQGGKPEDLDK